MDANAPQTCSKCMTPVGNDAVFLKNGTFMCPACYQRAYPTKAAPGKPKRFDVSVEGVIAIVVVIGVFVGGYFIYAHVSESRRLARQEKKEEEEREERIRQEEITSAQARAKEADVSRKEADLKTQAQREAQLAAMKLAEEARKKQAELTKAEIESRRLEIQRLQAEKDEKVRIAREEMAKSGIL